jgi:hypothetical protein
MKQILKATRYNVYCRKLNGFVELIIDEQDCGLLERYERWEAVPTKRRDDTGRLWDTFEVCYRVRTGYVLRLHRLIMGAKDGERVLNRNGNAMDCRRCNLLIVEERDREDGPDLDPPDEIDDAALLEPAARDQSERGECEDDEDRPSYNNYGVRVYL